MITYNDLKSYDEAAREAVPGYRPNRACTAYSWAAITGDTVDVAAFILSEFNGGKPPGRIPWEGVLKAYRKMGYKVREWAVNAKTVTTLPRELTEGRYLVDVSGGDHAVACVDGRIIDWTEGRRHRVRRVWKIEM